MTITSVASQTNQQINSIVLADDKDLEFLYYALLNLRETIVGYGVTGATMTNLSRGKFVNLKILYPEQSLVKQYHKLTAPIFQYILNLLKQNVNLQKTRDLLITKLISGELDVSKLSNYVNSSTHIAYAVAEHFDKISS